MRPTRPDDADDTVPPLDPAKLSTTAAEDPEDSVDVERDVLGDQPDVGGVVSRDHAQ